MNHKSNSQNCNEFKNWIKKRFINELDLDNMTFEDSLLWSQALSELSEELIDTIYKSRYGCHVIVPFRRGKG